MVIIDLYYYLVWSKLSPYTKQATGATNELSIQEFDNVMPHYEQHYSYKLVFSIYDLSSLGCEWLLSAVFPKIVTALKKYMTCYNFNLNFLFYYSQKLQTAINKFQNCLEVF